VDHVLVPGQALAMQGHGRVVVQALQPSRVQFSRVPTPTSPKGGALRNYFQSRSTQYGLAIGLLLYLAYASGHGAWSNLALILMATFVGFFLPHYSKLSNKLEEKLQFKTAMVTPGRLGRLTAQLLFNVGIFAGMLHGGVISAEKIAFLGGIFWIALLTTAASQGIQYIALGLASRDIGEKNRNVVVGLSMNVIVTAIATLGLPWAKTLFNVIGLSFGALVFGIGLLSDLRARMAPRRGVAVFFGTFNPFHNTHLEIIRRVLEDRKVRRVYLHTTVIPKLHADALRRGEIVVARREGGMRVYSKTPKADVHMNYFPTGNCFYEFETRRHMIELAIAEAGLGDRVQVLSMPETYERRGFYGIQTPDAKPELLLVGHLDTVFEKTSPFQGLRRQGDRLIGPGVIDMKGGVVLMLDVLGSLRDTGLLPRVKVVLNDDEEIGSPASKQALTQAAKGIPYTLVFEPGLPDGSVVASQSGVRWLKLAVKGRGAHAGMDPQSGVNACVEASHKAVRLNALTSFQRGLTVNVGTMTGGTKPNIICEEASLMLDVRYIQDADLQATLKQIERIQKEAVVSNPKLGVSPTATLETVAELPSLPPERTRELRELASQAATSVGQRLKAKHVGYASDGNHLAQTGTQLLVGLGPYGGGMHTAEEFLSLRGYAQRRSFNRALIQKILSNRRP
jgi:acetylornithine deacetylase/succinyl-diaminopimelate desuccinylase-like protein